MTALKQHGFSAPDGVPEFLARVNLLVSKESVPQRPEKADFVLLDNHKGFVEAAGDHCKL